MRRTLQTLVIVAALFRLDGTSSRSGQALRLDGNGLRSGQAAAATPTPILVELFTSEGCADCPPADAVLEKLIATQPAAGMEVIGLGQHVDYWDQLGWKDRFSSAALTNRQRIYSAHFNLESIYTPQMVVDGRAQFVGSDGKAATQAIARALAAKHGLVRIDVESDSDVRPPFQDSDVRRPFQDSEVGRPFQDSDVGRPFQGRRGNAGDPKRVALHVPERLALRTSVNVTVSDLPPLGRGDHADIIVAITEDHLRSSVTRGENHGRTLTHAAVVRSMTTIGQATEGAGSARAEIPIAADWQRDQLKVVAFVQEQRGRAILASAATPLQTARR
jgi:hypothetical protein